MSRSPNRRLPTRQTILNRAATAASKEKPDKEGALAALLVMIAVERLRLKSDSPQIARLRAIAGQVLKEHEDQIVNAASSLRMADRMLGLSIADYQHQTQGDTSGTTGSD